MALFTDSKEAGKAQREAKTPQGLAYAVLLRPRITEKSYSRSEKGQYTFQVASGATKAAIKKAVKEAYGVDAVSVNIVRGKGKYKTFGRSQTLGQRSGVKKAYVTLAAGQTIELFQAGI